MTSIRVLMFCGLALMVSAVSEAGKRSKGWTQCAVSLSQGETDLGTVLGWGDSEERARQNAVHAARYLGHTHLSSRLWTSLMWDNADVLVQMVNGWETDAGHQLPGYRLVPGECAASDVPTHKSKTWLIRWRENGETTEHSDLAAGVERARRRSCGLGYQGAAGDAMAQAAIAEPDAKESTARVGLDKAHAALRQCYQDISLLTVAVGEGKRAESLPSDHLAMCRAFRVGGDPHRGPNVHRSPVAVGTTLEGAREVAAQEMTRAVLRQAMSGFFQARATASPDSMQSRMAAHMTQSLTAILPTATAEDVAVDCRLVPDQPTEESSWVLTVEEEVLSECGWDPQRGQTKPSLSAPALLAVPEARERLCHESLWVDGMQTTLAAMQVATPEMVPLLAGNGTGLVLKCLNACQQMHLSSRDTAERLDWGVHADHGSEEAVWQGLGTALEESDIPRLIALNPQGAANPGAAAHFKQFAEMMSREQAFSEENLAQTKELLRQAFDAIAIDGLWFIVVKKRE